MQKCATCGVDFELQCPACSSSQPIRRASNILSTYSLLLAPGLLAGIFAYIVFPPLDAGPLLALGICTLSLPLIMQVWSLAKKRLEQDVGWLCKAYLYSGIVLLLIALFPLLATSRDKSGTRYYVTVSSWRPGRS